MTTTNGRVAVIKKNTYGFYSFAIGNDWYSAGKDFPFEKGDVIEFDFYLKDEKWKTVRGEIRKLKAAPAPEPTAAQATSAPTGNSREDYWTAKAISDAAAIPRIIYMASLERAIAYATLAVSTGALSLDKAKVADKLGIIQAFVDEQTARFANSAVRATLVEGQPQEAAEKAPAPEAAEDAGRWE